jgi:hypothetical protein
MLPTMLLTPLLLTAEPVRLEVPDMTYNHSTQTSTVRAGVDNRTKLALTMNGTQTYAFNGRPYDADNDN